MIGRSERRATFATLGQISRTIRCFRARTRVGERSSSSNGWIGGRQSVREWTPCSHAAFAHSQSVPPALQEPPVVLALARRMGDPLVLGDEHPDERAVLAHALEVLAGEGALPFTAGYAVRAGDIDDVMPAPLLVAIAHGNFVIAPRRGVDDDRLGQGQQLESQFRSGWRRLG